MGAAQTLHLRTPYVSAAGPGSHCWEESWSQEPSVSQVSQTENIVQVVTTSTLPGDPFERLTGLGTVSDLRSQCSRWGLPGSE